ncbi:MAG TPA: phospho-N-acetylmuramoyl-pentapeptide-transferase [Patescibacteria group bacterium]
MEVFSINLSDLKFVFLLGTLSFVIAMLWTPIFTDFLFKNRLGKKIRQTAFDDKKAPIFYSLHKGKENTPTMGGLLIWITAGVITLLLNLDRAGTWLPLFVLIATGLIGAADDLMNIYGIGPHNGGMQFRVRFLLYTIVAVVGAWWFYSKLGFSFFHIPGYGNVDLGIWYMPFFVAVLVWTAFSANQTDGLDGLAGGVMAIAFSAFAFIALFQGKVELAALCLTIVGSTLAFLWFNIYPARFFMGDTGIMPLGMTLAVIAFLTNSVFVLPVIGIILMIEGVSTILQIGSKKLRGGKKIFRSAPIHHHFEALGWPETKVTERFWIISAIGSVVGLVIALVGKG